MAKAFSSSSKSSQTFKTFPPVHQLRQLRMLQVAQVAGHLPKLIEELLGHHVGCTSKLLHNVL